MVSKKEENKLRSGLMELFGGVEKFEFYENLKTHAERVKFVYAIPVVQNMFHTQAHALKTSDACMKNDRESKRLRDLGNSAFKSARDRKALELYSEALAYADPNGKDNAYALALANRSAVQVRLGGRWMRYALLDIDRALIAGHPNPLKIIERKVTCLEELGLFSEVHTFPFECKL